MSNYTYNSGGSTYATTYAFTSTKHSIGWEEWKFNKESGATKGKLVRKVWSWTDVTAHLPADWTWTLPTGSGGAATSFSGVPNVYHGTWTSRIGTYLCSDVAIKAYNDPNFTIYRYNRGATDITANIGYCFTFEGLWE